MAVRPSISVRAAEASDAPVLARLSRQLGHAPTAAEVLARLDAGQSDAGHCIFVAVEGASPLGWLELWVRASVATESWAEISGLVVDEAWHGKGVGGELVQAARRWAQQKGFKRLRVRTRMERAGAARFYERAGFQLSKEQRVYELEL